MHNESTLASDDLSKGEGESVSTSTVSGPSASDDNSRTVTTETLPAIGHGLDQTQDSVGLPSEEMLVDNGSTECEPSDDISCIMQLSNTHTHGDHVSGTQGGKTWFTSRYKPMLYHQRYLYKSPWSVQMQRSLFIQQLSKRKQSQEV